ncbi:cyclase family protein [Micromonospora sp. NPDC005806]|uniref:cyclase family protein n=1 Tax=Micromonospora sp. NPDC005806 TaxID=3364234 RepID=UPI0036A87EEE
MSSENIRRGRDVAQQWRAEFDAEITFTNGGGLTAHGFRLDVDDEHVGPAEVGAAFVRELGLLMVADVAISGLRLLAEPHKGRRAVAPPPAAPGLVELSHRIHAGMITYPGLPGPQITAQVSRDASRQSYAPGTTFQIDRITMVANTGTYLDTPYHRFADGYDLAGIPAERFADLPGVVVRLTDHPGPAIGPELLAPYDVAGRAVLVHTGWDRHFGTATYGSGGHPYLTRAAVDHLVAAGAVLVGIDSINVDDTTDGARPAHTGLLAAGVTLVEHLTNLEALPVTGFRFHAAPAPVAGMGTFPVRAYAVLGA